MRLCDLLGVGLLGDHNGRTVLVGASHGDWDRHRGWVSGEEYLRLGGVRVRGDWHGCGRDVLPLSVRRWALEVGLLGRAVVEVFVVQRSILPGPRATHVAGHYGLAGEVCIPNLA